jgi:hypothetical protein
MSISHGWSQGVRFTLVTLCVRCTTNPQQIEQVEVELVDLQQVSNKSATNLQLSTSPTACYTTNSQQIEQVEFEL